MSGLKRITLRGPDQVSSEGGESAALVISQPDGDPGGWVLDVYAQFDDGVRAFCLQVVVSPRGVLPSVRVAALVSIPMATGYYADVTAPAGLAPTAQTLQAGFYVSDVTAFKPVLVAP